MLFGNNLISVLNTETSKAQTLTIEAFYNSLIEKANKDGVIDIALDHYKIRDEGGYTDFLSIWRSDTIRDTIIGHVFKYEDCRLDIYGKSEIILFDDTREPTIGFHGLRVYDRCVFTLDHPIDWDKYKFKIFRLSEDESLMDNFVVAQHEINQLNDARLYSIYTKSSTFNCNGFFVPDGTHRLHDNSFLNQTNHE